MSRPLRHNHRILHRAAYDFCLTTREDKPDIHVLTVRPRRAPVMHPWLDLGAYTTEAEAEQAAAEYEATGGYL